VWKLAQHLVFRAELLPETEEVAYQKVTAWGSIATRRVKIGDLELASLEQMLSDGDHSERGVRGLLNRQVAFKVKGSQELLLFERNGIWH
jgi:hypothetical protein